MSKNKSNFGRDVKRKLKRGVDTLYKSVSVTMGPFGRNVLIQDYIGDPHLTKDGVTVAESVESTDKIEDMAIKVVRQAARETAKTAGDGTTTSIVLAKSLFNSGLEYIHKGGRPIEFKRYVESFMHWALGELHNMKKSVSVDDKLVKDVAVISSNGDNDMAEKVHQAYVVAGEYGIVKVEEGSSETDRVVSKHGLVYRHDQITRNIYATSEMKLTLKNPGVFVTKEKIETEQDLSKIIQKLDHVINFSNIVVFAYDFSDDVKAIISRLNTQHKNVVFCKLDGFGERRFDTADDIIEYSNGKSFFPSDEKDHNDMFGEVESVTITPEEIIIKGSSNNDLTGYIQLLEKRMKKADDFEKGKLEERIAKLKGTIVTIFVGGQTEAEMKERKDRFDDATMAVGSAIAQGILPGGGNALATISRRVPAVFSTLEYNVELADIFGNVLCSPLLTIMKNGYGDAFDSDEDSIKNLFVLEESNEKSTGGSFSKHYYVIENDLVDDITKYGVVDPYLVTVTALKNAVSVATNLLMTEVAITNGHLEEE